MGTSATEQSSEQTSRNRITLGIVSAAAILGAYFAVEPFFDGQLLTHHNAAPLGFFLIFVFVLGPPLIMGVYGHSVGESAVTGILVPAGIGVQISDPAFPPIRWLAGVVVTTGYALPVAVFMFTIGAALRRDGTVRNNKRRIALAVIVSLLCAILVTAGISANILTPGGDH
jgi:hypothetical protein